MADDIRELADQVRGDVLLPSGDGYEEERGRGFQTAYHHEPSLIVAAASADDARAAVRYALDHDLPVAVQATGHGVTVPAREGVLVTTGRLTGVDVDPEARTARVEAGVRWADVASAAAKHGLAPLSGSAPGVGVVGYALAGGIGLLGRRFGFAADHVRAIEVVTPDGEARRVTAGDDPDLFWALRGARDNFGLVTAFEVDLLPLDRVFGASMFFDVAHAERVFAMFAEWTATVPDELTSSVGMVEYPPLPVLPEPLRGKHVVHVRFAYTGDAESGREFARPWQDLAPRLAERVGDLPYTDTGSIYGEPDFPHAYDGNNVLLSQLPPAASRAVHEFAGPTSDVPCIVDIRHLGGVMSRPPEVPGAVCHRDARYILRVLSPLGSVDPATARAVHQRVYDAVRPWTLGRSLNFIYGESEPGEYLAEVYDEPTLRRLRELKATVDPANTFRLTRNVFPPS